MGVTDYLRIIYYKRYLCTCIMRLAVMVTLRIYRWYDSNTGYLVQLFLYHDSHQVAVNVAVYVRVGCSIHKSSTLPVCFCLHVSIMLIITLSHVYVYDVHQIQL